MGLFDSNTQLTEEERGRLEDDIEKAKGVYRVYPPDAEPGESHWSDGSVSWFEGDATRYGCFPSPGLVPVRINSRCVIYMSPEDADRWQRSRSGCLGFLGYLLFGSVLC